MSKGSRQRPLKVSQKEFEENWDKIFSKEEKDNMFKQYRKKSKQLCRPYIVGEDMTGMSVSEEDTLEEGGMIAMNADNPKDCWYIAKDFFEKNYEEV